MKALAMSTQSTVNSAKREPATGMFWFYGWLRNWFNRLFIQLVSLGYVPAHLAFIMDGNRRFARKYQLTSTMEGHRAGSQQLDAILNWCFHLGVKEVTVYAFSHENFKRSPDEVDGLFRLGEEAFRAFTRDQSFIHKNRIRIRICGDLSLLPESLQRAAEEVMRDTERYCDRTLNVCCAYTASREIYGAVINGVPQPLYIQNPVDLVIRTSGERQFNLGKPCSSGKRFGSMLTRSLLVCCIWVVVLHLSESSNVPDLPLTFSAVFERGFAAKMLLNRRENNLRMILTLGKQALSEGETQLITDYLRRPDVKINMQLSMMGLSQNVNVGNLKQRSLNTYELEFQTKYLQYAERIFGCGRSCKFKVCFENSERYRTCYNGVLKRECAPQPPEYY